jgi:hypothetical protein
VVASRISHASSFLLFRSQIAKSVIGTSDLEGTTFLKLFALKEDFNLSTFTVVQALA